MTVRIAKPKFNLREKLTELDKPSGLKGNELMRSETTQDARNLISAGRRNKIINGAMQVIQRGSSIADVGDEAHTFTLDRWKLYVQNSTARFTVSQDSDSPEGFGGSMKIECTTTDTSLASTDEVYLEQRLEGQDVQDFAKGTTSAKEYTLSFYAKTAKRGTYIVNLLGRDNTTSNVSAAYTVSNTGWNRYTLTFPADTNSSRKDDNDDEEALRVLWWFVAGSAVDSGSLQTTWANSSDTGRATGQLNFADSTSNIFYITGCQLEVGSQATEFEHRSYGEELALCQRYYIQYGPNSALSRFPMMGECTSSSVAQYPLQFPVMMRGGTGGVSLTTNGSATDYQIYSGNSSKPCSAISLAITFKNPDSGCWGVRVNMSRDTGDLSTGHAAQAYAAGTSILGFSKEL